MFQLISKAAMQRLFFFSFLFLFYRLLKWDSIKPLIDHKTIVTKATLHQSPELVGGKKISRLLWFPISQTPKPKTNAPASHALDRPQFSHCLLRLCLLLVGQATLIVFFLQKKNVFEVMKMIISKVLSLGHLNSQKQKPTHQQVMLWISCNFRTVYSASEADSFFLQTSHCFEAMKITCLFDLGRCFRTVCFASATACWTLIVFFSQKGNILFLN